MQNALFTGHMSFKSMPFVAPFFLVVTGPPPLTSLRINFKKLKKENLEPDIKKNKNRNGRGKVSKMKNKLLGVQGRIHLNENLIRNAE